MGALGTGFVPCSSESENHLRFSRPQRAEVEGKHTDLSTVPPPTVTHHDGVLAEVVGHSFAAHSTTQQTFLNPCYIPDTALGPRDVAVNEPEVVHHLEGETE